MIVRITFDDNSVMLFGDSYKPWTMQSEEYIWNYKKEAISTKFESSKDKWIGWGGLKWCSENNFQQQLDREGCQDNEPDNPQPRQYSDMVFVVNNIVKNKALKYLKR